MRVVSCFIRAAIARAGSAHRVAGAVALVITAAAPAQPAPWWTHPPADEPAALYSVGEGASLEDATRSALLALAGRLGTRVQGTISERNVQLDTAASTRIERHVRSSIAELSLSGFQVVENLRAGGRQQVLVRFDRQGLSRAWRAELDRNRQALGGCLDAPLTGDRLLQWRACTLALPSAERCDELGAVLAGLNADASMPSSVALRVRDRIGQLGTGLKVRVRSDLPELADALRAGLAQTGLQVQPCGEPCDLSITLAVRTSSKQHFGQEVVVHEFLGTLMTPAGEFGHRAWKVSGSSSDAARARRNATAEAIRQLEREGLWSAFGVGQES